MYTVSNDISLSPSTIWNLTRLPIGMVIQAFINGGLVSLGVISILLLSGKPGNYHCKNHKENAFWKWFIGVLLGMNIIFLTLYCIAFTTTLRGGTPSGILTTLLDGSIVLIVCLTDGVLVRWWLPTVWKEWWDELMVNLDLEMLHGLKRP